MSIRSSYACSYNEGVAAAYEWDETKSQENLSKHGLSFDDADIVFSGPCVTFEDTRFDYGEPRFITLGHLEGHVVVVALTPRRIGLICYLPDFGTHGGNAGHILQVLSEHLDEFILEYLRVNEEFCR